MKIFQLSSHSTLKPHHGGPIRSHNIGRCLEEAGVEVARMAICLRTAEDPDDGREPIIDPFLTGYLSTKEFTVKEPHSRLFTDYYSVRAVDRNERLRKQVLDAIAKVRPDVILLEHPWAWLIARRVPEIVGGGVRVVYSAHNVEAPLKRSMLDAAGREVMAEVLNDIEALERDLVRGSWATIACTQADADVFSAWGAPRVVVAGNGARAVSRSHLRRCLPAPLKPDIRYALTVGSAYRPNVDGFLDLVAPAVVGLRPNCRVVTAGGMSEGVRRRMADSSSTNIFKDRLIGFGQVDELVLDALIENAAAILLPITYGGGSNLKTAEALLSGKLIVATNVAFRGFEQYQRSPHIAIADDASGFASAMNRAFQGPPRAQGRIPHELSWEASLAHAIKLLKSAARDR